METDEDLERLRKQAYITGSWRGAVRVALWIMPMVFVIGGGIGWVVGTQARSIVDDLIGLTVGFVFLGWIMIVYYRNCGDIHRPG
jgi:hypothetical protein